MGGAFYGRLSWARKGISVQHYVQIIRPMRDALEVWLFFLHTGIAELTAVFFTWMYPTPVALALSSRATGLLKFVA